MASESVAWLAGLLEGEGYFAVRSSHESSRPESWRPSLHVRLKMTDKDVVERALSVIGNSTMHVGMDTRPNEPNCKPVYYVSWGGQEAEKLMQAILPYMGKRRAAKIQECLDTHNLSHQPRLETA